MNLSTNNSSIATPPRLPAASAATTESSTKAPNQDLKLQVATQYCAKGRSSWGSGNHADALTKFRHALLILETILGAQHVLVAQLYHWMGLIFQELGQYRKTEQCFIKYLRIRYALNSNKSNDSHNTLPPDSNTLEAQVSLSNLWQAQGISSSKSFEMIQQLQESVQLELEGDSLLLFSSKDGAETENNKQNQAPNYILAMKTYQQAMNVFPDAHHDAIMSKLAMCYHKARGKGANTSTGMADHSSSASSNNPNYFLDQAVVWYRMALKVFCTSCRFSESVMEPSSVHQSFMTTHPEYKSTQKNLEAVLQDYHSLDFAKMKQYLEQGDVRKSVLHQCAAEEAMSAATKNADKITSIDNVAKARKEYQEALRIEKAFFQSNNDNNVPLVVLNIQKELSQLDQKYIARLEQERVVSNERLGLLEHQSSDWISTVRHQEEQLNKLQSSLENREGHAVAALNAAASKEAELVGWKRKFETMQKEWKASQKRVLELESDKASLQQQLKQAQSKVGQLEYTFKKQDLDFHNFQDTMERKKKEADGWKEQYQAAQQAQQHTQRKWERSEATERELRAQIKDLQSQNLVLKDWNKELQAEQQVRSRSIATTQPIPPTEQLASKPANVPSQELEQKDQTIRELQTKLQDVTHTKVRAIKKLKKYHTRMQQPKQGGAEEATEVIIFLEDKVQMLEKQLKDQRSASPEGNKQRQSNKKNATTGDSGDRASLLARLDKSNEALATLHAEHRAKLAELVTLQKSKAELETGAAESQEIITMLKKANDERVEKCDALQAENSRLKALAKAPGHNHSKSFDANDVFSQDNSMDTTSNMLIDQVADLELQNEDLREQLEKRTDDNRNLAKAVKTLKEKLNNAKEVSLHSNSQSRSTKVTVATVDMDRRLKEAEEANDELAATIETMRKQIMDLTSPDRDDSSGRSSVRATVLGAELREAKMQIERLATNAKMQQTESEKHDSEEKQRLNERISELEKQVSKASEKEEKLSGKLKDTKDKLKTAREEIKEKEGLLSRLSDIEKLEQDLEGSQKMNNELKSQIIALKTEAAASREKGDETKKLKAKLSKLEEDLKTATAENEKLSTEVQSYKEQMNASSYGAQEENMRLIDQCTQLESKLEAAKIRSNEEKEEAALEKQTLEGRISELEEDLVRSREQTESLSSEIAGLGTVAEDEHKQLQERCAVLEKQKKQEDDTESERNQALRERCSDLEQELVHTTERNERLAKQVNSLSATVRGLQTNAEKAGQELEQANITIENLKASERPGDDDFGRLLERCTDLEAEKAQIEWQLKQQQGSSEALEAVEKERDELQQELDMALSDLVEFQQMGCGVSNHSPPADDEELKEKLGALVDAKDELKKLLDEAVEENVGLVAERKKMQEQVEKAQKDRDEIDGLYQQAKHEIAEFKAKQITAEELINQAKAEGEELSRLLEIEKQVSSSRKAAANSGPDEENELEDLYRQAREEMKELEEMLMEAEEQIEHLKALNEKLSEKTELSRHDLIETELSSETVHSLEGLSREELMKENRKTLHKLQEARTHAVDQQENITILQAQLRDAMKFHATRHATRQRRPPPRRNRSSGGGGAAAAAAAAGRISGFFNNRAKRRQEQSKKQEAEAGAEIEETES